MVKNLSKHAEWLSLIEISGPFLTVSILDKVLPQGLEAIETPRRQKLRAAYEEWREAVDQEDNLLSELHQEWVRLVLMEILEYDHESLVQAADWPVELPSISSQEHAGTFKPDWIVRSPADGKPRMFIAVLPPDTDLESVQRGDGWPVSLQERMTLLCRSHGVRVGLVTDGERWMLVNAPEGSTSSQASWYARLWCQEPITLKAFHSLLGVRRCFGPAEDTLESLLDESLKHHEEVTDTLGEQVRRAVEVLVQCLDKADEDRNRELLHDVKPTELYEAGLTVMMRLVFVLCAEERGLLLLGDSIYDRCYAVSTLRGQLAEEADRDGPEVLDRRYDAWARLLAMFRAIYGGIEHENLRMPALGGSLFDPDRFPFLEGRAKGTRWRDTSAAPLPIDNRTVLLLLNSLQILEQSGGALLLSYRALDVEQIGHVYEGLLEHTVTRVPRVTLGLQGSQKAKDPNVALAELESVRLDGETALVRLVQDVTGRSESAIRNGLSKPAAETIFGRVLGVCGGDTALTERIQPFMNLIRTDAWDDPIVYRDNSFMVTLGADRRETGTHYTPKSLTESIVTTTLEPVVYVGPAEGKPREEWTLKSSREILDLKVCDPAMGSGAFLVQACRYLGEKLVEAWLHEEAAGKAITVDGKVLDQLEAEEPLPSQLDERLTIARRMVAERCLYGVDINPLAAELAKLSIWLVTLAKGRPFGFLDHNLRSGDSLLGIHRLEQLTRLRKDTESTQQYQLRIFGQNVEAAVNEAIELRKRLRAMTIRDITDVEAMAQLDRKARRKLESVELIADAMIGEALRCGGNSRALDSALDTLAAMAGDFLSGNEKMRGQINRFAQSNLAFELPSCKSRRKPFHWPLEFPEVAQNGGFNSVIGNPPFAFGKNITASLGSKYNTFLVKENPISTKNVDLCAHFFHRAFLLLRSTGTQGLLATSSIAEGETRIAGLESLISYGGEIYSALSKTKWPGKANVYICQVFVSKGAWRGTHILNGKSVDSISSFLTNDVLWEPKPLKENDKIAFYGAIPNGDGFFLSEEEASSLLKSSTNNQKIIFPFLTGKDLNSTPLQTATRYAINFWDWTKEEAEKFEDAFQIIRERVKPHRLKIQKTKPQLAKSWWLYEANPKGLHKAIGRSNYFRAGIDGAHREPLANVMVIARVSSTNAFSFVSADQIFDCALIVVASNDFGLFSVLQSGIHFTYAWQHGGKMKYDLRYSPTMCFATFPFPEKAKLKTLYHPGLNFDNERKNVLGGRGIGLTRLANLINNPSCNDLDMLRFRDEMSRLDMHVAHAYGWDDLNLDHGFHQVNYLPSGRNLRFTIAPEMQTEILRRLSLLNHERHEKETKSNPTLFTSIRREAIIEKKQRSDLVDDVHGSALRGAKEVALDYLQANKNWLAKDDILSGSGLPANQWQSTINQLLADGLVERQGERRGVRYQAVIEGEKLS